MDALGGNEARKCLGVSEVSQGSGVRWLRGESDGGEEEALGVTGAVGAVGVAGEG